MLGKFVFFRISRCFRAWLRKCWTRGFGIYSLRSSGLGFYIVVGRVCEEVGSRISKVVVFGFGCVRFRFSFSVSLFLRLFF